jgi:hypothetical protein
MVTVDQKGYVFGYQAGRNEFPFQLQLSPSTFNTRPQLSHITLNLKWPSDPESGQTFKNLFTESMISFSFESLKYAEKIAKASGHRFIREEDVDKVWKSLNLKISRLITITSFDKIKKTYLLFSKPIECFIV